MMLVAWFIFGCIGAFRWVRSKFAPTQRAADKWDSSQFLRIFLVVHRLSGALAIRSSLAKSQKRQLCDLVKAGPEAAGYPTGCWTSLLIQDLIYQKFHVLYHRLYVCELLHNLGFSRQKARFVSDHLDEEARQRWTQTEWPKILSQARQLSAPLLFGDKASFALY